MNIGPKIRDYKIGIRANEEIVAKCLAENRCFGDEIHRIGCTRSVFNRWGRGESSPSATYLAEMVRLGYDVIYILTGKRRRE